MEVCGRGPKLTNIIFPLNFDHAKFAGLVRFVFEVSPVSALEVFG